VAVAIRVVNAPHALVFLFVVEQALHFGNDPAQVGPHQFHGAGLDGLGAFGPVAHDQNRFAQRGTFLLDAAGVGQHQPGAPHQVHKRNVIQGFEQQNILPPGETAGNGVEHIGIAMHRIYDLDIAPPL